MRLVPVMTILAMTLAGCGASVQGTENSLAQAGFQAVPANTPARQAALVKLQPHKFSMQVRDSKVQWVYADPTMCHCLYVGDQFAYDTYQARLRQRQDAQYEQIVRLSNQNNEMGYPFQWNDWQ